MSDYVDPKYFKKSTYSATGTIIGQFIAGVVSLALGLGFIYFMTKWSNSWDIYWSDGNKNDFLTGYFYGSFGLLALIIFIAWIHFDKVPKNSDLFRLSIKTSFYGGLAIATFVSLVMLLLDHNFILFLAEFIYDLTLAVSLGVIVGGVQVARIQIEKFDPVKHKWLMSNKADLYACQSDILPYRQQVYTFWLGFFAFVMVFLSIAIFMVAREDSNDTMLVLGIPLGLLLIFLFLFLKSIILLFSPDIQHIEGVPTKTYTPRRGRYRPEVYKLTCNGRDFLTDIQTWGGVRRGLKHKLWYSGVNNRMMAFERITPPQSNNAYLHDIASEKDIEKRKLRSPNRKAPWLIGFGTVILTILWKIIRRKPRK